MLLRIRCFGYIVVLSALIVRTRLRISDLGSCLHRRKAEIFLRCVCSRFWCPTSSRLKKQGFTESIVCPHVLRIKRIGRHATDATPLPYSTQARVLRLTVRLRSCQRVGNSCCCYCCDSVALISLFCYYFYYYGCC